MAIKYLFAPLLLMISLTLQSQNIAVQSFTPLPNDLDARVHHQKRDQNGQLAAIIKIVTTQTGFDWEPDMSGIVAVERKTGEYWLWVPRGARRLTIKHDQLGILRNYEYPIPIEGASVYEMVLATGEVVVVVRDREIETQWLVINTRPEGANLFIDDQMVGTTPHQGLYEEGTYNYRLELPRYHNEAGRIELKGDREFLEFNLRPRFGNIEVTSTPESGMMIFLNGENTGQVTPATIEGVSSGQQQVRLQSQWYQPQTQNVTVSDSETTRISMAMQPAFANITINTEPRADILINGSRVGNGDHSTRLLAGIYELTAQLEKHDPVQRQLRVETGRDQNITLTLQPQTGNLQIVTQPFNARITLNGEQRGTTPTTLRNLLVGDYTVVLSLDGHGTVTRTITVREGQTTEVNETLQKISDVEKATEEISNVILINEKNQEFFHNLLQVKFLVKEEETFIFHHPCLDYHTNATAFRESGMASSSSMEIAQILAYNFAISNLATTVNNTLQIVYGIQTAVLADSGQTFYIDNIENLLGVSSVVCKELWYDNILNEFICNLAIEIDKSVLLDLVGSDFKFNYEPLELDFIKFEETIKQEMERMKILQKL